MGGNAPSGSFDLRVQLLGGFRVEHGGESVPVAAWQGRKSAQVLVKLLALVPGHRLHRDQILDTLWPDLDPQAADRNLRKAVHYARHALEPELARGLESRVLHLRGGMLLLDAETVQVDVDEFERLASEALAGNERARLERAIAAYSGELLPEDRYEDWTAAPRERLAALHVRLLEGLAALLEREGAYPAAIAKLQEVLRFDSTREDIHRWIMRLHALSGELPATVRQYHLCVETLRQELDVEPEPETEDLYRELVEGKYRPVAPPAAPGAPHPLPRVARRPTPYPLVGRERALAVLLEALDDATKGEGTVVLLGGEAGVGKTRLMLEAVREAHARGAVVLWGGCYELEGAMPYGPFVEALEGYLAGLGADERTSLADSYPELSLLLPSLAGLGASPQTAGGAADKMHLFAAVSRLLGDLGTRYAVVLALDDLHTADPESLELLHHLARQTPHEPWLLLGTYRGGEIPPGGELHRLRASLTRAGICRRVDLHLLARVDSDRLVEKLLPEGEVEPALVDEMYSLSLGNPLFLEELAQALRERGSLELVAGVWRLRLGDTVVPTGVRELVEQRVHRLGETVERVLGIASVAGAECEWDVLCRSSGMEETTLLDALERALQAWVLEERGRGYGFRHPLIRAALYKRLSAARRRVLHGVVARALEELRPDDVASLAHHYLLAGVEDKATAYLEQAGDRAEAVFAHGEAERDYRRAAEAARRTGDRPREARVLEKLGATLATASRYDEALAALEQSVEAWRTLGDAAAEGRVTARIGRLHRHRGSLEEGIARIERTLPSLAASAPSAGLAALYLALHHLQFAAGRIDDSLAAACHAAALGQAAGDPSIEAEAEVARGSALSKLGRSEQAARVLEAAIPAAVAVNDLRVLHRAYSNLGFIRAGRGEFEPALQSLEQSRRIVELMADPAHLAFQLAQEGLVLTFLGKWEEALARLERAHQLLPRDQVSWYHTYPPLCLGQLLLYRGQYEQAGETLREALDLALAAGDLQGQLSAQGALAELDLAEGRPEAAVARLAAILPEPASDSIYLLSPLAEAYLLTGDEGRSEALLEQADALAHECWRRYFPDIRRVRGMLLGRRGRWDEAAAVLGEAASIAQSMPYPYAEGRACYECGLIRLQQGAVEAGQEALRHALAIFRELGAAAYVLQICRLLAES